MSVTYTQVPLNCSMIDDFCVGDFSADSPAVSLGVTDHVEARAAL